MYSARIGRLRTSIGRNLRPNRMAGQSEDVKATTCDSPPDPPTSHKPPRYNVGMPFSSARGTLLCVLTATLLIAQDWQTSQNLPAVDFTGLTPAQKALALKVLRANGCP